MTNRPPDTRAPRPGRNDPCPCGSGRKFKACCAQQTASIAPPPTTDPVRALVERATQAAASGHTEQAIATLTQATARAPNNAVAHRELGRLLLEQNQLGGALRMLERAAALSPDDMQAQALRARALELLGWPEQAAVAYRLVLARSPRDPALHTRLAAVLTMQGNSREAAASLRAAARHEPRGTARAFLAEALALLAENDRVGAKVALERTLALDPANTLGLAQLGKLHTETGVAAAAWNCYERLLTQHPRLAGHYYDLTRIRRLGEPDRALIGRMADAQTRTDLHPLHRIMLGLALGKAHDDLGEPGPAMTHYLAANALKGQLRPLDRATIARRVAWAERLFSTEQSTASVGRCDDATPILVIGMPRSGTTLVESLLACHSQVAAGEELAFWSRQGRELAVRDAAPDADELRMIAAACLDNLRAISAKPHVTDKKPDNFFWAGLVNRVFPLARIVHCRRNPRDTCVSILGTFFAPREDFSTAPDDLLWYYRQYLRLMAHWRAVLPADRFLEIDYETLVSAPEATTRRLLAFCALPWEDACLHPERTPRTITIASQWQARQPVTNASVGRWKRYQPWPEALADWPQAAD